jgi:hypothetical protein
MNMFIKFSFIISTLIGLNFAGFNVYIKIDKSGLKSEPRIFEGENGQFLVKMAKWSENDHLWEYNPEAKNVITKPDGSVTLDFSEKWKELFYNPKRTESFLMAVKVEMVDNKLVINN